MKLLLLPKGFVDELIKEYGAMDKPNWFQFVGDGIKEFYDTHRGTLFTSAPPPITGCSIDALKATFGYKSKQPPKGANYFIRDVLAKKYGGGLNWEQYLEKNHIDLTTLYPQKHTKNVSSVAVGQQDKASHICARLSGYWLSRFEYVSKSKRTPCEKYQINIERMVLHNDNEMTGYNISIASPNGRYYPHELRVERYRNFLIGRWDNTDQSNSGVFQLHINNTHCVMEGLHLGNANDNSIQHGIWLWIKISDELSEANDQLLKQNLLKQPTLLTEKITDWLPHAEPITLADVLDVSSQ